MNKIIYSFVVTVFALNTAVATNGVKYPVGFKPKSQKIISFTENKGQVYDQNYKARPDVLFSGSDAGLVFHLKNNGISYQLNKVDVLDKSTTKLISFHSEEENKTKLTPLIKESQLEDIRIKTTVYRLDVNWLNANSNVLITKGDANEGFNNYYFESCPNGALNVKSYASVTYQNIYKGIDLKWYEKHGDLKYDYIIEAGVDYKQIQLEFKGAKEISINKKGELTIKTPLGDIIEQAPFVMQEGRVLKSKWLVNNNIISFDIENLNANQPYVIDPAVRVWGTYYGGSGLDYVNSCIADNNGNVYLTGLSTSNTGTEIATTGAHQSVIGSANDAYLVKFNSLGVRQWGTYYGGADGDRGLSCATDALGNLYLAGQTTSSLVIATTGAHQSAFGGGFTEDAFLVKFDALGVRQWGTYYGGVGVDFGQSCTTDASGNVYLAGYTESNSGNIIATVGAHQSIFGGNYDAFIVKFNSAGVRQWGTYYGGNLYDGGSSCITDASGNVYLSGDTESNSGTVIATAGAHQSAFGGGFYDAFLVKFNSAGVRQWGTYYGEAIGGDYGNSCATDATGNVYLAGYTDSNTGTALATVGAHQSTQGGNSEVFLAKFNSAGVRQWGTYYGGVGNDYANSCSTDASGNVYVVGRTDSNTGTIIATAGAHQSIYGGGASDAILVKFTSSGLRDWGTYYGGAGMDVGSSCTVDATGNIYLGGYGSSNTGTIIASTGSHQDTYGGGGVDAYLVKFNECVTPASPINTSPTVNQTICTGNTTNLSATGFGMLGWYDAPTGGNYLNGGSGYTTPILTANITYYVQDSTCSSSTTRTAISVTVNPLPSVTAVAIPNSVCSGGSVKLTGNGASTYTWSGGVTNGVSFIPTITDTYTVTGTDANGCSNIAIASITVNQLPIITANTTNTLMCSGETTTLTASGASTYTWSNGDVNNVSVVSPTINTTYTVNGIDINGCYNTSVITQSVSLCTGIENNIAFTKEDWIIYPNPAHDVLMISGNSNEAFIELIDVTGKQVYSETKNTPTITISLRDLSGGLYLIKIKSKDSGIIIKKIIIQ